MNVIVKYDWPLHFLALLFLFKKIGWLISCFLSTSGDLNQKFCPKDYRSMEANLSLKIEQSFKILEEGRIYSLDVLRLHGSFSYYIMLRRTISFKYQLYKLM